MENGKMGEIAMSKKKWFVLAFILGYIICYLH